VTNYTNDHKSDCQCIDCDKDYREAIRKDDLNSALVDIALAYDDGADITDNATDGEK
jgi:hypothetical protein